MDHPFNLIELYVIDVSIVVSEIAHRVRLQMQLKTDIFGSAYVMVAISSINVGTLGKK